MTELYGNLYSDHSGGKYIIIRQSCMFRYFKSTL